jgi:hypothetical protein
MLNINPLVRSEDAAMRRAALRGLFDRRLRISIAHRELIKASVAFVGEHKIVLRNNKPRASKK